jgi:hypothetical protein
LISTVINPGIDTHAGQPERVLRSGHNPQTPRLGLVIGIAGAPNAGQDGVIGAIRATYGKGAWRTELRLERVAQDVLVGVKHTSALAP